MNGELTRPQARAARMRSQLLTAPAPDPVAAARHMLAVQAQNYGAARQALALRSGVTDTVAVDEALRDGRLIRTWPMRGTHHIMAADDVRWLTALNGGRGLGGVAKRREALGLSLDDVTLTADLITDRTTNTARETLPDGHLNLGNGHTALTRTAVKELIRENGIDPDGNRSSHMMRFLCQTMVLVQGPEETFTAFANWVPDADVPEEDPKEAMVTLVTRHLAARAPATEADIAWWSHQTVTTVRRAVTTALSRGVVKELLVDGLVQLAPADFEPPSVAETRSLLDADVRLPAFDEYLMGYRDRTLVVDPAHTPVVGPTRNGLVAPVVVSSGKVVATWKGGEVTYLD